MIDKLLRISSIIIAKKWQLVLLFILFLYLAFPVWFKFYEDFDPSGKLSITDSLTKGSVFGVDNIFHTYGPLGLLTNRLPTSGQFWWVILFDILIVSILYQSILLIIDKKLSLIHVILAIFLLLNIGFQYDGLIMLLASYQLFLYISPNERIRKYVPYISIFLSILAFFIKANFGIIMLPIALFANVYLLPFKLKDMLLQLVFAIFCFLIICYSTNTAFIPFLQKTLSHIQGYSSVQYLEPDSTKSLIRNYYVLIMFGCILIFSGYQFYRASSWKTRFIISVALFYSFVLFKSSIVRADTLHLDLFIGFIPFLSVYIEPKNKRTLVAYPFTSILIVLGFTIIGVKQVGQNNTKVRRYLVYVHSYFQSEAEVKADAIRNFPKVSDSMLKIIGSKSITCIPYNYSVVSLQGGLNYVNTPIVQSFHLYTKFLDSLNANYYREQKVNFILEHSQWPDPLQALVLENTSFLTRKQYYQPVVFDNDYLLLGKREQPLLISCKSLNLNAPVQSSQLVLNLEPSKTYRISFKYQSGIIKKLRSAVFKYPNVPVTIQYNDTTVTKPIGYIILERGIVLHTINHSIKQLEENYLAQDVPYNNHIKKIKFNFEGLDVYDISYSLEEINFKSPK